MDADAAPTDTAPTETAPTETAPTDTAPTDLLTVLEAERAIQRLKHTYLRACDAKDPEAFRACFVREGTRLDYGPLGVLDADGMAEVFRRIALHTVDGAHQILDMHHAFHPVIDLTSATEATGKWTLRFRQVDLQGGTERVSSGEYRDTYAFEDGGWKIRTCTFTPMWQIERPLEGAKVVELNEAPAP